MLLIGSLPGIRIFRNNVGNAYQGTPVAGNRPGENLILRAWRRIQYGLFPGSSDLIGWKTITITPEMVGAKIAVFTSIEVKSETGRIAPAQRQWIITVLLAGGIAGVVRSPEQALELVNNHEPRAII